MQVVDDRQVNQTEATRTARMEQCTFYEASHLQRTIRTLQALLFFCHSPICNSGLQKPAVIRLVLVLVFAQVADNAVRIGLADRENFHCSVALPYI